MHDRANTPDRPSFLNDKKFIAWRLQRTPELDNYWMLFRKEHPECSDELDRAIDQFKAVRINGSRLSEAQLDELWKRIRATTERQRQARRQQFVRQLIAAASIILIFVSGFYLSNRNPEVVLVSSIVGEQFPEQEIQLHTGQEVVALTRDASIVVYKGRITVTDEQTSVLSPAQNNNKLVVPYGQRATLTLADGTKVWHNSGTELEFPGEFAGPTRDITVSGEIYLEVTENPERPFRVHTDKFDVRVLGTKFNVSAYADDPQCAVVLVAGKVAVETGNEAMEIVPGQMATYNALHGIARSEVDVEEYISWKDNVLLFRRATISEILQKIGRYYNVSFDIGDKTLSEKTCTGKLYLASDIDDIMQALTVISDTSYKREGNTVYITRKSSLPMEQ